MLKKQYNPIWAKQQEEYWYNFWRKLRPPWRPTTREIKFFEQIIKKLIKGQGRIKVLVLGSTPEYRDMLARHKDNLEVTLLDLNPPVKKAMDRLRKIKNRNEKFVVGDWLKMDKLLPHNYFDVVMNDEGFENIDINKHLKLFRNIAEALKEDGYFFMGRACLEYCFKHPLKIKKVIQLYQKNPKKFRDFRYRLYILYRLAAGTKGVYDYQKQGVQYHVLTAKLLEAADKRGITKTQYLQWMPWTKPDTHYVEVDVAKWKRLKSMVEKYFTIKNIYRDLFHPVMKVNYNFVLQPKKQHFYE